MSSETKLKRDDEIDFRNILGALIDHKRLILIITGTFVTLSVLYSILTAPVYEADAMLQVEHRLPTGGTMMAGMDQLLNTANAEAVTEIALITSRSVVGKAVNALKLYVDARPRTFPLIGSLINRHFVSSDAVSVAKPLLGLRRYGWGGEELKFDQLDVPDSLLGENLTLEAEGGGSFIMNDSHGDIILHGKVGKPVHAGGVSVLISRLKANPGTLFDVQRNSSLSVVERLQLDVVALEQGKDSGIVSISYQNEDPTLATRTLQEITQEYVRQNVARNSEEAAKSLQFVRDQLPKVRGELEKAQTALKDFELSSHSVDIGLETKALLDQVVSVETNIQQVRMQQVDAQQRFQAGQPTLRVLDDQLAQLNSKKASLKAQISNLPDTQRHLLQLTRDVEVSSRTYTDLLTQAQQLDVARAGTVGNVRVVDVPEVDTTAPVRPRRSMIILCGLFAGLAVSMLTVYIKRTFNLGIVDPSELEAIGIAVSTSIPFSEEMKNVDEPTSANNGTRPTKPRLLALDKPNAVAIEALRGLQTSLHFDGFNLPNKVLMVTGISQSVGKTFVACNLATVFAQSGRRVLLVDGDMRRGIGHANFGVSAGVGLSDLLDGSRGFDEVVHKQQGHTGLDFVSRGTIPQNPTELLMSGKLGRFLDEVKGRYDLIIVDTPPILAVTDAAIIGNHADASLMVVRCGVSEVREVQIATDRLRQAGIEIKGVVFNAVEPRTFGYMKYSQYKYESDSE
ncbi:polysaccharide biosynthesis tyrosine autokinase [Paraburkholderia phymatum]|uniref:Putative tyrosine-protein kinase EpsB n=1 Tax=Paraburkholderia phymatum (strain DSM 17167 / CIP 108236 / LMG 21445 / STM815) TaxID=391038 RepID=B2JS55_PARP8|nr:polysaccharide biosynthesis tyrosine autokinase [Paraburkholderia phymatum]ACC72432.1 capsular exopolysaccharide family [Paraburkholderia phymatum STM815]